MNIKELRALVAVRSQEPCMLLHQPLPIAPVCLRWSHGLMHT